MSEASAMASWEAYVDDFDDKTVHLVMASLDNDADIDDQEFGEFPIALFDGINLLQGLLLTIRVFSNETIEIKTIPRREADTNQGEVVANLIKTL